MPIEVTDGPKIKVLMHFFESEKKDVILNQLFQLSLIYDDLLNFNLCYDFLEKIGTKEKDNTKDLFNKINSNILLIFIKNEVY